MLKQERQKYATARTLCTLRYWEKNKQVQTLFNLLGLYSCSMASSVTFNDTFTLNFTLQ